MNQPERNKLRERPHLPPSQFRTDDGKNDALKLVNPGIWKQASELLLIIGSGLLLFLLGLVAATLVTPFLVIILGIALVILAITLAGYLIYVIVYNTSRQLSIICWAAAAVIITWLILQV